MVARMYNVIGLLVVASAMALGQTSAPEIQARLEPATIGLGQAASLQIEVSSRGAVPELPRVGGLRFHLVGRSTRSQSINGVSSLSFGYEYQVVPERTGRFEIPIGGRTLRLEVADRPVASSGSGPLSGPARSRPTAGADAPEVLLEVVPERAEAYVGERVPVTVRLMLPEGTPASLQTLPQVSGSAFTLDVAEGEPRRSQERVRGRTYAVYSWDAACQPLKAGRHALDVGMALSVRVPVRSRPNLPPGFGSMFDESFFQGFFGSYTEKDLELEPAEPVHLEVRSLPVAGRPEGFGGAVGTFTLECSASARAADEGDPITLRTAIVGFGDTGRIDAPVLPSSESWKVYRPRTLETTPAEGGRPGRKVFEHTVVAHRAGELELPRARFSYFDPERAAYVTLEADPMRVSVAPAKGVARSAAAAQDEIAAAPDAAAPVHAGLQLDPGSRRERAGSPLVTHTAFLVLAALAAALAPLGLVLTWRGSRGEHRRARRRRARGLGRALREVERARVAHDSESFVAGCRAALPHVLDVPASAVTLADVERRGLPVDLDLRSLLEMVNEVPFSGRRLGPQEMLRYRDILRSRQNKEN